MIQTYPSCYTPYSALNKPMHEGAFIITPNNRLAETLIEQFYAQKTQAIAKPLCFAYPAFLKHCFKQIRHTKTTQNHPTLLTDSQLQLLWQTEVFDINTPQTLISAVQQAFVICENFMISFPHPAFQASSQTQEFETWCLSLKTALKKHGAITAPELAQYIIQTQYALNAKQMVWVAFDEYTKTQKALQHYFSAQGIQQTHFELPDKPCTQYELGATDKHDEYAHLVEFIKTALKKNKKRIGVVVPNLNQAASDIKQTLSYHFDEEMFNLSLGEPLKAHPLIAHALQLLKLNPFEISRHQINLLLSSPYITGATDEFLARATCLELPLLEERTLPFKQFKQVIKPLAPKLFTPLNAVSHYPSTATTAHWANLFYQRLNAFGFPGDESLSSVQYQYFERFKLLLEEFISLAVIQPTMSQKMALHAFQTLASTCIFQPQKKSCPIHVLGLLEASGVLFDTTWVCHATDEYLPAQTKLNAFIPIALQRDMKMPYTDATREYELTAKRLTRFKAATETLIFSYPQVLDDINTCKSPFIQKIQALPLALKAHTKVQLERAPETYQIPFTTQDKIEGGSARLTNQALCPFKAFATHRLHATSTPQTSDGLSPGLRGQILHEVLEKIWQHFPSQKALLACHTEQLSEYIDQAITSTLASILKQKPTSFPKAIAEIEHQRLESLVEQFLNFDKSRSTFKVAATEKSFRLTLSTLNFQVRVDRLDEVSPGVYWLIDYKTRIPSPLPFDEPRPAHPQLLLYALIDKAIQGLVFVASDTQNVHCKGVADDAASPEDSLSIKGIRPIQFNEFRLTWHERLNELALEFYQGTVAPAPKKASTCQTCEFHALCRIGL